jgi:hypothetical protein
MNLQVHYNAAVKITEGASMREGAGRGGGLEEGVGQICDDTLLIEAKILPLFFYVNSKRRSY